MPGHSLCARNCVLRWERQWWTNICFWQPLGREKHISTQMRNNHGKNKGKVSFIEFMLEKMLSRGHCELRAASSVLHRSEASRQRKSILGGKLRCGKALGWLLKWYLVLQWKGKIEQWVFLFFPENEEDKENIEQAWFFLDFSLSLFLICSL